MKLQRWETVDVRNKVAVSQLRMRDIRNTNFPHSVPDVPRWKEKHGFNGNLTTQGTTELLKRLREEKVRARSQKKKDKLDKETEAALSSDSSRNICEVSEQVGHTKHLEGFFLYFFSIRSRTKQTNMVSR